MEANGNKRQESSRKNITAECPKLGVHKVHGEIDCVSQPCANGLEKDDRNERSNDDGAQRGEKRIKKVGHDLSNGSFKP